MNNSYAKYTILIFVVLFVFSSCKLVRFVVYNFADINDHKKFPSRKVEKQQEVFRFYHAINPRVPKKATLPDGKAIDFSTFLSSNKTVAFLIIQNDSILYESYFSGYDSSSVVPSFSVAKSVTSILIGCAIDDGYIKSVDEPITNYLPQLLKNGLEKVTIKHLLNMTSGIRFNESYVNPFGHAASFYYGTNLDKEILTLKLENTPGKVFHYNSGNTQLLGHVLAKALNGKSISQYLQEKIWQPMHMEFDASWSTDRKNGIEKTFCCLNTRARDFAKIGRLFLNKGNWNGKQIVSQKWVEESVILTDSKDRIDYYQYQWWLPTPNGDFMAQGILGQYIYVNPAKNMIIVRLGKDEGDPNWTDFFVTLANAY